MQLLSSHMTSQQQLRKGTVLNWSIALTLYYVLATVFFMDIGLHDETTFYLGKKDDVTFYSFLTEAEYGPLYAAWYKVISLVVSDNIALYFVSWALLVVLSVQLMRIATSSVSSIIPILLMLGLPIFKVWPYVGVFAGALILLGFVIAQKQRDLNGAVIITTSFSLLVGLARPEYLYGPALILLACLAHAVVRRRADLKTLVVCLVMAAAGLVISSASDTGRGAVAFEQHFNLRASERGEIGSEVPWTSKHSRKVFFNNTSGDVGHKISDYVKANPGELLKHVARNIVDFRTILLSLACAAVVFFLHRAGRPLGALYVAFISLPPLMGCTLIYPRNHYIVSVLLTLIAGGWIAAASLPSSRERLRRLISPIIVGMVAVVLVFPVAIKASKLSQDIFTKEGFAALHPVVSTALDLREMEDLGMFKQPFVMFDPYGGIHNYLRHPWQWIPEFHVESRDEFLRLLRERRTSSLLINRYVIDYYGLSNQDLDSIVRDGGYQLRQCIYLDCVILITPH